ncbi:MAG: HU family DNA-binding protein [Candidatus Omnitrophica bacterium]|nr:HU family DNA-binding protein [Candidatus Omnitrophota bacterium]MCA9416236.1 HU family DNA-binding protein [Candidatus Omnitrophota bacterium]MCA9424032.1 HU family DNA-binding protein [Candidatus Omnitrophota bacterium]MCA9431655.1 HU family DNA-binding protein [Candidatus Omnitrophota bacterium]MCA9435913.1 HU family DNA-binding protein [Candidatus Omnitrophota bacterium]
MSSEKSLTKTQLLNLLAEKSGLKKQQVATVLDELAEVAYSEAKTKEKGFTLPGFGKLVLVDRPERMGRNPQTGEQITIPAKKVVKFRIAKVAKDSILG